MRDVIEYEADVLKTLDASGMARECTPKCLNTLGFI
jgi:hypothetical protein